MGNRSVPNPRKVIYAFLVDRDGNMCRVCKHSPPDNMWTLEVDHRNGNANDWRPSNLRLLCRSCNAGLNNGHRTAYLESDKTAGLPAREVLGAEIDYSSPTAPLEINQKCHADVQRWIIEQVQAAAKAGKACEAKDLVNSAAYIHAVSSITVKRYLDELTATAGPLREEQDSRKTRVITLKPALNPSQMGLDGTYQTHMEISR